jgi:hypothetical protein
MKRFVLATLAFTTVASTANALDSRLRSGLLKLDPDTRLEQRCDAELLTRIAKDTKSYRPDRVIAYTFSTPKIEGNEIKSRGAAFRSKGEWYHLAFKCETASDRMEVIGLKYKIGDEIPEASWQEYNLFP